MFKKKLIRVEFYNADSGDKIGYDEQRLKALPEDFEAATFVEIDGQRYQVIKAEPEERKQIKRGGSLIIQMVPVVEEEDKSAAFVAGEHEVQPVQRKLKTFVSASRPDIFPAFTGQRGGLRLMEMGTWEWRAAEFIHAAHILDIKTEFASIRDLKGYHARVENGREVYSQQHRRSLIKRPLGEQEILLEDLLRKHFSRSQPSEGITFMGSEGYADGGFSMRLEGGMAIYGLAPAGEVAAMGMSGWEGNTGADVAQVQAFMAAHGFVLVDWEKLEIVEAEMEGLETWFSSKAAKPIAAAPIGVPESAVLVSEEEEAEVLAGLRESGIELDDLPEEGVAFVEETEPEGEAVVEEAAMEGETLVEAVVTEGEDTVEAAVEEVVEAGTEVQVAVAEVEEEALEMTDLAVESAEVEPAAIEEVAAEAAEQVAETSPEALPELTVVDIEPIESKEEE